MRALVAQVAVAVGRLPVPIVVELGPGDGSHRGGTQIQIVVHARRRLEFARLADRLPQPVAQSPGEFHFADLAGVDVLDRLDRAEHRAALRAGLADPVVLPRGLDHAAAFADVVADRLLDVDVLAGLHRPNGRQGVPVVRRGDRDDVDRLVVKRLADVADELGLAALLRLDLLDAFLADRFVRVADARDLALGQIDVRADVVAAAAANADDHDAQPVVGAGGLRRSGLLLGKPQARRPDRRRGGCQDRVVQETTSCVVGHDG